MIGVCASGILIRAVAPLLNDKRSEPPVISVSDDGSVVVPLLGGHRGANRLARRIAKALSGVAAVTTAGDVALGIALDEPPAGWRLGNPEDAKNAMALLLSGVGARIGGDAADDADWLKELPEGDGLRITCDMRRPADLGPDHLWFAPQKLAIGVGSARGCPTEELRGLIESSLAEANASPEALAAMSSIDVKADEAAMNALALEWGVPYRLFNAEELEAEADRLTAPSDIVFAEVGCHGVAEGAALAQGGENAELVVPKRKSTNATCAVAIVPKPIVELAGRERGRVSLVGIGPGKSDWRTPEASKLVSEADDLVGYGLYIDLLGPLAFGKERHDFPLGGEEARCRFALERAAEGRNVAIICSGDAGIYAMGALVFELLDRGPDELGVSDAARRVDVVSAPGVSALQGAAARAGAPLGHDFCAISLSDLLTPREDILRRIRAAAESDFVIAFYNPVSKRRRDLLALARDMLLQHRPADCPVLLASSLGRPEEELR